MEHISQGTKICCQFTNTDVIETGRHVLEKSVNGRILPTFNKQTYSCDRNKLNPETVFPYWDDDFSEGNQRLQEDDKTNSTSSFFLENVKRKREEKLSGQTSDEHETQTLESTQTVITEDPQQNPGFVPEYIQCLLEGSGECGDSYIPFSKPEWLDMDKFRRGQQFAQNNIFGVIYCQLTSLLMLFAFKASIEPLIFTNKSNTKFRALKRYFSTVTRVKSWYEMDIWDVNSEGHKNVNAVRKMHESVRSQLVNADKDDLSKRFELNKEELTPASWKRQHEELSDEFKLSCPMLQFPLSRSSPTYVNQCDMAVTQFGFAGLILLYPRKFGIHNATKEDLEGFAHFWRTIGFLLGIKDRYNFCDGDLATVRQRSRDIVQHWVRPSFRQISCDWLHMSRCVFDGMNYFLPCSTFELVLLYLCNVLEIHTPKLEASLSIVQHLFYAFSHFLFSYLTLFPGFLVLLNTLINFSLYVYNLVIYIRS